MHDEPSDNIPLAILGNSHFGRVGDSRDGLIANERYDDGDDDDDEGPGPPPIFISKKIPLITPPVFAPAQNRWPELFRKLVHSPYAILAVVLAAILAHRMLVAIVKRYTYIHQLVLGPIAITIFMLLATMRLHFYQLNYGYQQPHLHLMRLITTKAYSTLFVVCIIAPLLILPIFDSTYLVQDSAGLRNASYAILSSWSPVIPNLRGSLPSVMEAKMIAKTRLPPNPWAATAHSAQVLMPDAITFPLPENGKGKLEGIWNRNWEDAHALYMPVLAVDEPDLVQDSVLESDLRATTQMLAARLICRFANISSPSLQINSDGSTLLSVRFHDKDSCAAQVHLKGLHLEADLRATIVEEFGQAGLDEGGRVDFTKYHLQLARSDAPVTVYMPAWSRLSASNASANETLCRTRLGMVGLSRAFYLDGVMPSMSLFEAASCEPQFMVAPSDLTFRRSQKAPFHGPAIAASRGAYLGNLAPSSKPPSIWESIGKPIWEKLLPLVGNLVPAAWKLRADWEHLETSQNAQLREGLLMDATEFPALGGRWAWPIINEGLGDFIHDRPRHVGSLLLAGKLVRQSFVAKLATAAELTLREQLAGLGPDVQMRFGEERRVARVVRQVFQDRMFFQILLWSAFFLLSSWVVYTSCSPHSAVMMMMTMKKKRGDTPPENKHEPSTRSLNDRGWVPWPLCSPVARAMLLRHSSVRPWLQALRTGRCQLKDLPSMHIGNWRIHEKAGKSGWRLDSAKLYRPEIQSKEKKVDPQLENDILADVNLIALGIIAGLAVVGYSILQGVAVGLSAKKSHLLDGNVELWRILGTANLEPKASFWPILFFRVVPASLIFYFAIFWLPSAYLFFCGRQAWSAMLREPQPACQSITLDYATRWFPLSYAIGKKHWLIAALAVGNLVAIMVSTIQPHVLRITRVRVRSAEPVVVPGSDFEWAVSPNLVMETGPFDYALRDLINSSVSSQDLSHWSASEATILPLNLEDQDFGGFPYAVYETPALFAGLECEEVLIDAAAEPTISGKGRDHPVAEVWVQLDKDAPSATARIPLPCSMPVAGRSGSSVRSIAQPALCMRWWLHDNSLQDASDNPRWILAVLNGTGSWSTSHHELQFSGPPSAVALACRSTVRTESAQVIVSTNPSTKRPTSPIQYDPLGGGSVLEEILVAALDRGLNGSNTAVNGVDGGVIASDGLLYTDHFVGDILSWILYQQEFAACLTCVDIAGLRRGASRVYAAYVAALADQRDPPSILTKPKADPTPLVLQPFGLENKTGVNWGAASFQLMFVLFCLGMVGTVLRTHRSYVLPLSPEPLLHSLVLLDGGNVVPWLEAEFSRPEKLSLREIHKRIDRCRSLFMLEPLAEDGQRLLSLNVMRNSEEEVIEERYYDDVPADSGAEEVTGSDGRWSSRGTEEAEGDVRRRTSWRTGNGVT